MSFSVSFDSSVSLDSKMDLPVEEPRSRLRTWNETVCGTINEYVHVYKPPSIWIKRGKFEFLFNLPFFLVL